MMDAPPALCQTVDLTRLAPAALAQRRAAARGRMGETLYFRAGDDLLSFPATYALSVPDLARFGCLTRTREVSFAFRLSDLAPAGEGAPEAPGSAGPGGAALPSAGSGTAAPSASSDGAAPAGKGGETSPSGAAAPSEGSPAGAPGPVAGPPAAPAGGAVPRPDQPAPAAAAVADPGPGTASPRGNADGALSHKAAPDDMIVRVVALYIGRHADFRGMTRAIASVRKEEARRGFVYALERFPTPAGDRLVRISEDRCLILSLPPDPAAPGAVVDMRFQNEDWSAVVEVPAGAAGRWEAVYAGIERFLAAHLVRNAFRK